MSDERSDPGQKHAQERMSAPPAHDLPGYVAGELTPAQAERLLTALAHSAQLCRQLFEVAGAAAALHVVAECPFAPADELPPLHVPRRPGTQAKALGLVRHPSGWTEEACV